ncbi:MAG: RNA methyltransferase [Hyphomicrobiales bacterium]|nr:RNA methyltransferase [Hyphomicrobiales bacterium]PCH50351.1 MAG: RNA methyltransferase [Hyphomicrobiales bacterium]
MIGSKGPRGYFGIGIEGVSKPMNFGNLSRSAYGFGSSFVFTVAPGKRISKPASDTTSSYEHMPWYSFDDAQTMTLPDKCRLVGVELTEDAIELPSFHHPTRAAYILGPEGGSLSPEMQEKCEFIVKIPITYCINVAMAGVVVMYDRMVSLGRFAERPIATGGPKEFLKPHVHGKPLYHGGKRLKGIKGRDRTTKVGKLLGEE